MKKLLTMIGAAADLTAKALAAAVAIGAILPTVAGTALTVTPSGEGFSVSVPAGAVDADSGLYLVWDSEDHGDELSAWPVANRVAYSGPLSESAASYTLPTNSLPENYCARVIAAKAVNVIDGYILLGKNASGASRCINTGITAKNVYGIAIKYRLPGTQTGNNTSVVLIGGSRNDGTIAEYNSKLYLRWHNTDYGFVFPDAYTSRDVHEIVVSSGKAYMDGEEKKSGISTGSMGTVDKTVLLSAGWYNNTIERFMHAEWYYARLYGADGSALRELVPALTNNSVAVFYDKVSHKYLGNANSDLVYSGAAAETNFTLAASAALTSIATATWTGDGETAFLDDAGNWTPGLPGAFSTARIEASTAGKTPDVPDGATTYTKLFVGVGQTATLLQNRGTLQVTAQHPVTIGTGIGSLGTYNITGGTLSCPNTGDSALFVGQLGGAGYLNISGDGIVNCQKICPGTSKTGSTRPKGYVTISGNGELNVRNQAWLGNTENEYSEIVQGGGTFAGGNDVYLGSRGTVKYIKTGGKFTVAQDFLLGKNKKSVSDPRGDGTLEHGGGTITVTRYSQIGSYGTGTYVQSGGSIQCNNWTSIGRYSGGIGYCTVTGGTFTVKNTAGLYIGEEGTGTLTVGGTGVVTAGYGTKLGAKATGEGTLKLGGNGKIVTKYLMKGEGAATLAEFDGGTIQAMADEAAFLGNLGNIQLGAGGLTIDTQGYNLGITNCTFNVSSGSGKLNVVGGGTVTFKDLTVNVTDNPSQAITFAERTDGGTFEFEGGAS